MSRKMKKSKKNVLFHIPKQDYKHSDGFHKIFSLFAFHNSGKYSSHKKLYRNVGACILCRVSFGRHCALNSIDVFIK